MSPVYIVADNIISPLGETTAENFLQLGKKMSGIQLQVRESMNKEPFFASLFPHALFDKWKTEQEGLSSFTRFEILLIRSIQGALQNSGVAISNPETLVIISSTKGNIELLEKGAIDPKLIERISLHNSAKKIAAFFKLAHTPVVISNACISGLAALLTAKRMLEQGIYKNAVVVAADLITKFVYSGFQSFQAISKTPCRPFDKARDGISLGEAAGTIILSVHQNEHSDLRINGGAISNDANHISGPSRTGEELCIAISKSLKQSNLTVKDIGFISAHGTATVYNDEMEAKAFSLAGMEGLPVNSIKGYYGHTLGAAGVIESVIALQSLKEQIVIPTLGFSDLGVSRPVNISNRPQNVSTNYCLKTASGFGGCNAALVFSRHN